MLEGRGIREEIKRGRDKENERKRVKERHTHTDKVRAIGMMRGKERQR